jgi:GT2 family glycosyltransferase
MHALPSPRGKLRVHSILYGNEPARIVQAIEHLERAADIAIAGGVFEEVVLIYGDCSSTDALREAVVSSGHIHGALSGVEYRHFDENLGSARGHNRLLQDLGGDYVLVMNPDIMMSPNVLVELARPFLDPKVGMVEAKQLPIEHPKEYDLHTGETCWAATACTMIPVELISHLGGFDADTFFLYCDDVDFSWRVRLAGRKVIYQPTASVYHDKRLGPKGRWQAGEAEKYYSAEAALLLAYKYSRNDVLDRVLSNFRDSSDRHLTAAADSFDARRSEGRLPLQIDSLHKVAVFKDGLYATHRFVM